MALKAWEEGSDSWGINQGVACVGSAFKIWFRGPEFPGRERASRVGTRMVYVEVSQH